MAALLAACSPTYHHGPPSDHFTGTRFFNPEGESGPGGTRTQSRLEMAWRELMRSHRAPPMIAVTPSRPPARVAGPAMLVTWVGHATVLVQADGLNILTDPVWADRASPVSFAGARRVRAPGVRLPDLPRIDLILLSHDHYDHMDMAALRTLWARDRPLIVTGLGNEVRLREAGIDAVARDWGGVVLMRPGIAVRLDRVHHWSQRGPFDRDATLWTGFTVTLPHGDLYFAGDTGPGDMRWVAQGHVARPPRLALLPIGAMLAGAERTGNHIDARQAVTAFEGLHAGSALGIHWGTFQLGDDGPDDPRPLLAQALRADHIAPDRFRALLPGEAWWVPPAGNSAHSSAK